MTEETEIFKCWVLIKKFLKKETNSNSSISKWVPERWEWGCGTYYYTFLDSWNLCHNRTTHFAVLKAASILHGGFSSCSSANVLWAWLEITQLWKHRTSNWFSGFSMHKFLHSREISLGKFWKQVEMLKEFGEDCFLHGQFWVHLSFTPNWVS